MLFIKDSDSVPSVAPFVRVGDPVVATIDGVQIVTGTVLGGGLPQIQSSDNTYFRTRSGFGSTFFDLHHMEMQVEAMAGVSNPATLDLKMESRIDQPSGIGQARLKNFRTGQFDLVGSFAINNVDTIQTLGGIGATDYVGPNGEIELRIKHIVFAPLLAFNFVSRIDWVEITSR
jgi:hypothetical protein